MANEKLYEDMEPREKFESLWLEAGLHKRPGADALLYDLEKQGFFDLPASIKHHSNQCGGLAAHTVNVADAAMELCQTNHAFKDCDKNAVLVAALLHDICKVNKYHETAFHKYGYEDRGLLGHGEESVIMAQRFIKLTGKEIIAIRWHMGAYCGKESWDTLGTAYDRYPEVLCLHFADMIATHYDER